MTVDISVVTPTFKRPDEVVKAVQSALSQQGVSVEVIVLDDSPEGEAREAIASLRDSRVKYVQMQCPSGGKPALVRNAGWLHAQGRFVHFLDDDDKVAEGAYATLLAALEAHPKVGMVFGCIEPFGDDPEELRHQQAYFVNAAKRARLSQRLRSRLFLMANMLFKDTVLVNSACIIRRECISALRGYDPDCLLNEDVDFYLRAIRRVGYIFVDRVVVHYRTGAPSLMHDRVGNDKLQLTYRHIHNKYRAEYGSWEYWTLKVFARTILRRI